MINKDKLKKLGDDFLKNLKKEFTPEQKAFIDAANSSNDMNDFLFQEHPDALPWYNFMHSDKQKDWFYSTEAEEFYNSADTFAKKYIFVLRWIESCYGIKSDTNLASLYANIVGRLKLKYSDFATYDGIFGTILETCVENGAVKDAHINVNDRSYRNGYDCLCEELIYTLHTLDGTPITNTTISLDVTSIMSDPYEFQFASENKDYEYLQALIIGFYNGVKEGYCKTHYDLGQLFMPLVYMANVIPDDEETDELPVKSLKYYLSNDAYKQYKKDMNEAEDELYTREYIAVRAYFKSYYKLDFETCPKFTIKEKFKNIVKLYKANEVVNNAATKTKNAFTILSLPFICIPLIILGVILSFASVELLSGFLSLCGIVGTVVGFRSRKEAIENSKSLDKVINSIKNDVEQFEILINQDDANKIDDEGYYINSIKKFSEVYKSAYNIFKKREERANKMYFEEPQKIHEYDIHIDESLLKHQSAKELVDTLVAELRKDSEEEYGA